MASPATVNDVLEQLGEVDTELLPLVQTYLKTSSALFAAACGRADRPFSDVLTNRLEIKNGTGTDTVWLDYPIGIVVSITLGRNTSAFDETLDVADTVNVITWTGRRLQRLNGIFGRCGDPNVLRVTYTSTSEFTDLLRSAIVAGAVYLWLRRGSEDQRSERIGAYSAEYLTDLDRVPAWAAGLAEYQEVLSV